MGTRERNCSEICLVESFNEWLIFIFLFFIVVFSKFFLGMGSSFIIRIIIIIFATKEV